MVSKGSQEAKRKYCMIQLTENSRAVIQDTKYLVFRDVVTGVVRVYGQRYEGKF